GPLLRRGGHPELVRDGLHPAAHLRLRPRPRPRPGAPGQAGHPGPALGELMAFYEYRCEADGAFEVVLPMGTAPASLACPECAGEAARVFTNPMLGTLAPKELV